MSSDLNKVIIIGRLTRTPELKYIQSGTAVANMSIANNKTYIFNNEKKEEVSYFDCIIWGKMAEVVAEHLDKGSKIAIEGRLQQRRWQDQEGNKKSKIEVVIDQVQFLDSIQKQNGQKNEDAVCDSGPTPANNSENPFSDSEIPF